MAFPKSGGFPREHTSGTKAAIPAMKAPMAAPPMAMPDSAGLPAPKAPKMAAAKSVSVKKPKPPSSSLREQNGM
jgi:hypothetical protein